MDHDWVAIGLGVAAVLISVASMVLTLMAEDRNRRNRSS